MNLDKCTPDQQDSIRHVNGPLLVSAGAGSGKTFTLTQRIAYALLPESGPAVGSIDEVLAITFTEKAAAEIKARVKRTLHAEGLATEALKVDAAWISTIHGMCARILRTHALELGIDPAFGIVGDAERADMLAAAINEALGADNDIIARGSYGALFDEFPARAALPSAPSVAGLMQALLDRATTLRGGLDAIDFGPEPATSGVLARDLLLAYEQVIPALEQAGGSATAEKARTGAVEAVETLQAYLAQAHPAGDLRAFAAAMDSCAWIGGNFKAAVKEDVKAFQAVYAHIAAEVSLALARPRANELLALAREVQARFEAKKRAAAVLDNDDLLTRALVAFEEHPDIAKRYEQRFKLVMVDEFQDTSQLQIDMIARLAGENFAHLCTVGDAQQSIYRFRGADVNVYERHKTDMRSPEVGALYIELRKNFRSHADVLSFVDRVFEQPCSFGENFMSLAPHKERKSVWRGSVPRIDLVLSLQPSGRGTGVSTDDVKRANARAIAERFAALRADGHQPGQMVVLLGKMTRAGVYAEALRAEGFECVIAGGSLFAQAPEVRVVARLAEALANPANTAALFEVLTSDMVRLSADDFLELSTEHDAETGKVRRRDLDRGFARLAEQKNLPERLGFAVRLFVEAQAQIRTKPLSAAVWHAVVASGWMARLEQQGAVGLACAGNVCKAIRLIESLEADQHRGPASTARAFATELAGGLHEAPGALSGRGGDVVKIMTIHASKGLEFPIVAVADFASASAARGKLVAENFGSTAFASLALYRSMEAFPQVDKRSASFKPLDEGDDDAQLAAARAFIEAGGSHGEQGKRDMRNTEGCSAAAYRAVLAQRVADEELAESRRKLYVALTRASEALVVAMDAKAPSSGKEPSYPALVDDIRSALFGVADFPEGETAVPYGGTEPARFTRVLVQSEEGDAEEGTPVTSQAEAEPVEFFVPRFDERPVPPLGSYNALRSDVFSYSSIAPSHGDEERADRDARRTARDMRAAFEPSAFEGDGPLVISSAAAEPRTSEDTDKATGLGSAFHRAAQFAVETGTLPSAERREALAHTYELSAAQRARLEAACARWFASATYAEACTYPQRRAEVPFFLPLEGEYLEGEIDLLCTSDPMDGTAHALIVDYKTGGSDSESAEKLYGKHVLQAQCYAYAVLAQGCQSVELRFVRVEREDAQAAPNPQEVCYHFDAADKDTLRSVIAAARTQARARA